jgi:hypothetical protein
MATQALTDATIWIAGYDFTSDANQLALDVSTDELDCTTFGGGGYRSRIAGLRNTELQVDGYWQSAADAAVDPQVFPNLGSADRVVTLAPDDAETSVAYMFQAVKLGYQMFGTVGEVAPFSLSAAGSNGVGTVRGQVAKAKGNISSTGATGSVVELGEVASGKYLYAVCHCFSIGTSFTLQIQSDTASNFPSATTQITIGSITATGATWGTRVAGPITDTFYRVNVSAVSGTSQIAVAIGIG